MIWTTCLVVISCFGDDSVPALEKPFIVKAGGHLQVLVVPWVYVRSGVANVRAIAKPLSLRRPFDGCTSRFCGVRSRCRMPCECSQLSPRSICLRVRAEPGSRHGTRGRESV